MFTQAGKVVVASYPGGSLERMAHDAVLDCSWKEGVGSGKARLTRQPNGTLQGTWGNAAEDHDGGQWIFVPKRDPLPEQHRAVDGRFAAS